MAVLINHYLNAHVTLDYAGYANGVIAIFFVLSGYGLSFSLAKIPDWSWQSLKGFYRKRLFRIYPLYWFALLCAALFNHKTYSITTVLAFPLHQASGIYWFISSLMQCYVAAPFLYLLLHKKGLQIYLVLILSCAAMLQIIFFTLGLPFTSAYFVYRDFFLGHLLLFALGLCLGRLLEIFPGRPCSTPVHLLGVLFFFGAVIWATRPTSIVTSQEALLIAPFFILACCLLVYTILQTPFRFPGKQGLTLIGDHSYSLYLLHLFYYAILEKVGLLQHGSLKSSIVTVALLPILILFCQGLENQANRLATKIQLRWFQ